MTSETDGTAGGTGGTTGGAAGSTTGPGTPEGAGAEGTGARSQRPSSAAFREFVASGWGPRPEVASEVGEGPRHAVARR